MARGFDWRSARRASGIPARNPDRIRLVNPTGRKAGPAEERLEEFLREHPPRHWRQKRSDSSEKAGIRRMPRRSSIGRSSSQRMPIRKRKGTAPRTYQGEPVARKLEKKSYEASPIGAFKEAGKSSRRIAASSRASRASLRALRSNPKRRRPQSRSSARTFETMALRRNRSASKRKRARTYPARYYRWNKGKAPHAGLRWRGSYERGGKKIPGQWVSLPGRRTKASVTGTKTVKRKARKVAKKTRRVRKYPARYYRWNKGKAPHAGLRWRKSHERGGKKIPGQWVSLPGRRTKASVTGTKTVKKKARKVAKRVRSGVYSARTLKANPYKQKKIQIKSFQRARKGNRGGKREIKVKSYPRRQWVPYQLYGDKGPWISMWKAAQLSALGGKNRPWLRKRTVKRIMDGNWNSLTKENLMLARKLAKEGKLTDYAPGDPRMKTAQKAISEEAKAEEKAAKKAWSDMPGFGKEAAGAGAWSDMPGFGKNPFSLALLPTTEQLKIAGKNTAVGAAGFAGAIAMGKALSGVQVLQQYLGSYTPVVGNLMAGAAMWAAATASDNAKLMAMRPLLLVGSGVAAAVNLAYQLVAGGRISASRASWVLPASGSVAAAPTETVAPSMGAIDVYEAALDGVGGIEDELEAELESMGYGMGYMGSLGSYQDEGIFDSGMGQYIPSPMGADVEEAAAGFGAYETVPMGADVEEAAAGLGAYLEVPLGADVEEAAAGFGSYERIPMGAEEAPGAAPLVPGMENAVQSLVRKRIASGQPMDDAFYQKLGAAAAGVTRKHFQQRQLAARGHKLQVAPRKPPVLRTSAPMYTKPVSDPSVASGEAERIPEDAEGAVGILRGGIF